MKIILKLLLGSVSILSLKNQYVNALKVTEQADTDEWSQIDKSKSHKNEKVNKHSKDGSNKGGLHYPLNLAPKGNDFDFFQKSDGSKVRITDPYRFLEDPDSIQTQKWTKAQSELTKKELQKCELKKKFKNKMNSLMNFDSQGIPRKHGQYYYLGMKRGLENQQKLYRIKQKNQYKIPQDSPFDHVELFMDPNKLSQDGTVSVDHGQSSWSDDGKYYAYQVKKGGSDWATIKIRNSHSLKDLDESIQWVKFSGIEWTPDNKGFFYSRFDAPSIKKMSKNMDIKAGKITERLKNHKLYYHRVGTPQSQDVLIYENKKEPDWTIQPMFTEDEKYLLLTASKSTDRLNLIFFADMTLPQNKALNQSIEFKPMIDEWIGGFNLITSKGHLFYFSTNFKAPKQRIVQIDINNTQQSNWKEVLPEHNENILQDINKVSNNLVITFLEKGTQKLKVYEIGSPLKYVRDIELPGLGSVKKSWGNDTEFFFGYTSFSDPGSQYRVDMKTFNVERIYTTKLSDKAPDVNDFTTDRVEYKSKDGTMVPMFIVRKKSVLQTINTKPEKPIPTLIHAYGGFGVVKTPYFSNSRLIWMNNMGGIFVYAGIRGGGEYGEMWHKAGAKQNKQNGFDDVIAAAEFLQNQLKITDSKHTSILGGSNGGLVMAAVANQRPDLFGAAVPQVPVTDMLRFQKFTIGHKWRSEYGSSEKKDEFDFLIKYSPLHTIRQVKFPAMLVTTGDHDDRVVPAHTYKYVAMLQEIAGKVKDQRPLLARIEKNAGHGGGKPMSKAIDELADVFGFIAKYTGVIWKE